MKKQKIAVIGSGVGSMTTVYALTQTKDWAQKYDITIYQMGWRSGGKGASGRNAQFGQRIQEHGLHVWAGFYQNAFRNMRACYKQLAELGLRDPDAPLGTIDKAFKPLSHLFLAEHVAPTDAEPNPWRPWVIDLPSNSEVPGEATSVPGPFAMLVRIIEIMVTFIEKGEMAEPGGDRLGFELPKGLMTSHKAIRDHVRTMKADGRQHRASESGMLAQLIADAQVVVHAMRTPENLDNDAVRRGLELADICLAYMQGVVTSDSFVAGYDVLDQWEFSDWLRMHGASEGAIASAPVRGCYDFVFGFPEGNTQRPGNVGAGTAIRAMSRLLFTYSSAIFQKMQAGMGDTVFGPYYQVLSALGVKFEFFTAARALHLDKSKINIESLSMVRQAIVKSVPYQPLVDVEGLPCWPSEPLWDQLVDGDKLKASGVDFESEKTPPTGEAFKLERGRDFDLVLLGASIGSLPYLTEELANASERWRNMLSQVKTVATHAAQFWLTETADALGWRDQVEAHNNARAIPASPMQTIITSFAEPLDTWADMSHLLPLENWGKDGPASLAYFCAPAPDGEEIQSFETNMSAWQNSKLLDAWPKAKLRGKMSPELFFDGDKAGIYRRVNMYGSERYVLSVAGSVFHRLAPSESGFANLILAGDWTRCGLNAGCVEAATMSGIAAASAISGERLTNLGAEDIDREKTMPERAMFTTNSISGTNWPLTPFFARGEMTGWFMFYEMPRDEVAALLPKGLYLGPDPMARPDMHTVGISFCHYHGVRGSFVPNFLSMSPYGEATFAIPNTLSDEGGRTPFLYPRRLYVNNRVAIFAGKFFYAMNKVHAGIEFGNTHFHVSNPDGLLIETQFEQHSNPVAASSHPAQSAISNLLDMSFVTRRSSGKLLYNAFNLELDRAWLAPVAGQLKVSDPDPGGFVNMAHNVTPLLDRRVHGLPGAFRVWCSWSMTNPLDSNRVRHATEAQHWLRTRF